MNFLAILTTNPQLPSVLQLVDQAQAQGLTPITLTGLPELLSWSPPHGGDGVLLIRQTGLDYSDEDLEQAQALARQYPMLRVVPGPDRARALRGKQRQAQWFAQHLIPHPPTWSLRHDQNILEEVEHSSFEHFIVKPERSLRGLGSVILDSKRSALSLLEALGHWADRRFILQPQLSIMTEWRLLFIRDETPPYCLAKTPSPHQPQSWRGNLGRGFEERLMTPDELPKEVLELGERVFALSGLTFAGIDLIETPHGLYVLEINTAPGFNAFEGAPKRLILSILKKV